MGAFRIPIHIQRPSLNPSCNRVWGETNSIKGDCDQGNFSSKANIESKSWRASRSFKGQPQQGEGKTKRVIS